MANIIPPLVSDSPPPPPSEDEDDDEFDDFRESNDHSYGCDSFSITSSPEHSPKKLPKDIPNSQHEAEFNFDPTSPKPVILNSKENLTANDSERSKREVDDVIVSVNSLKENVNEVSASESSSSTKSNDNIPSQLIFENKNSNQENEICDNSSNVSKTNPGVLNRDKNEELNLSNGFSVEDDSARKFASLPDYSSGTNWSADFVSSENCETNLDEDFSVSTDKTKFKSLNDDCDEFSDFSKSLTAEQDDEFTNFSSHITQSEKNKTNLKLDLSSKELQSDEDNVSSYTIHSEHTDNFDLVKDKNIEKISKITLDDQDEEEDFHNFATYSAGDHRSTPNISKVDSEDEDFGNFISHPVTLNSENSRVKSEPCVANTSEYVENKTANENSNECVPKPEDSLKIEPVNISEDLEIRKEAENEDSAFGARDVVTVKEESGILNSSLNDSVQEGLKNLDLETNTGSEDEDFANFVSHSIEPPTTESELQIRESDDEDFKEFSKSVHDDLDNEDKDDDFANFRAFTTAPIEKQFDISDKKKDGSQDFNVFSNRPPEEPGFASTSKSEGFTNFESQPVQILEESKSGNITEKVDSDDDFDDFAAFSLTTDTENVNPDFGDDEFGDFGDFTSSALGPEFESEASQETSTYAPYPLLDAKEAFSQAQEIIKDMFPYPDEELEDFQFFELAKDDYIFQQLQCVTETPALGYQWAKSASRKMLLKSLNIDTRNIMHGQSWNSSVPRFAANLGVQPLEPVKMEPLSPTPSTSTPSTSIPSTSTSFISTPSTSTPSTSTPSTAIPSTSTAPVAQTSSQYQPEHQDVPSAQFDWTGSGLENPLDYAPSTSTSQPKQLGDPIPDPETDDYEEFTSFQSSAPPQQPPGWPNVPLRETYISEVAQSHIEVDVCLQPTIVTPELPRKMVGGAEDDPVFGEAKVEVTDSDSKQSDDTEFDDFQMSYPGVSDNKGIKEGTDVKEDEKLQPDLIPNKSILEIPAAESYKSIERKEVSSAPEVRRTSLTETPSNIYIQSKTSLTETTTCSAETQEPLSKVELNDDDDYDDFTEFHSSVPLPQPQTVTVTPVLEPLKPTLVYSNVPSTRIDWPDPGISDDDMRKFEQAFSGPMGQKNDERLKVEEKSRKENPTEVTRSVNVAEVQPKKSEVKDVSARTDFPLWDTSPVSKPHKKSELKSEPKQVQPKQDSVEEDEWSDFVSVQKPSPIHKTKLSDRNQTSSPDLPLSVLNLGNLQPTKQPIPVVTPQGLVQTKLSSNTNSATQQKSNSINPRPSYNFPPLQPSIISNQYASQAYNVGMNSFQPYNFTMHAAPASNSSANQKSSQMLGNMVVNGQEDDEWGEFVSSPLPPQFQNSSTTVGHHNWHQSVPNARSNSGHLSSQSHFSNISDVRKSNDSGIQKKSSNVSGLVLPELDFLSLKQRTGVPRKK